MAGNEIEVCKFILSNIENMELRHVGQLKEIAAPLSTGGYSVLQSLDQILEISTSDARKKADIYLNGKGISIKQQGSSVLYNRLQRTNLSKLFSDLNFDKCLSKIEQIDCEVDEFYRGRITRDRLWQNFFTEDEFKKLVNFLMLKGSPEYGVSKHPAELILEAPFFISSPKSLQIYSFDEYFDQYRQSMRIAIRRSRVGQLSKSEHTRALSIAKKPENSPWVFHNIVSEPPSGWRVGVLVTERRTVYYLMLTKVIGS